MAKEFDKPSTLMVETLKLLKADERKLAELADSTQTGISYYWLKKFSANEFANPSVNRVQFLYEFLSGNKIIEK